MDEEDLTEDEKLERWLNVIRVVCKQGWSHVTGWDFRAPSGTVHDLSASDLTKLDLIEQKGLSLSNYDFKAELK